MVAICLPHYNAVDIFFLSHMQFDYPHMQCYNI